MISVKIQERNREFHRNSPEFNFMKDSGGGIGIFSVQNSPEFKSGV